MSTTFERAQCNQKISQAIKLTHSSPSVKQVCSVADFIWFFSECKLANTECIITKPNSSIFTNQPTWSFVLFIPKSTHSSIYTENKHTLYKICSSSSVSSRIITCRFPFHSLLQVYLYPANFPPRPLPRPSLLSWALCNPSHQQNVCKSVGRGV